MQLWLCKSHIVDLMGGASLCRQYQAAFKLAKVSGVFERGRPQTKDQKMDKILEQGEQLLEAHKVHMLGLQRTTQLLLPSLDVGAAAGAAAAAVAVPAAEATGAVALTVGTGHIQQQQPDQPLLLPPMAQVLPQSSTAPAAAVPSAVMLQGATPTQQAAHESSQQVFQLPVTQAAEGAVAGLGTGLVLPAGQSVTYAEEVAAVAAVLHGSNSVELAGTQVEGTGHANGASPQAHVTPPAAPSSGAGSNIATAAAAALPPPPAATAAATAAAAAATTAEAATVTRRRAQARPAPAASTAGRRGRAHSSLGAAGDEVQVVCTVEQPPDDPDVEMAAAPAPSQALYTPQGGVRDRSQYAGRRQGKPGQQQQAWWLGDDDREPVQPSLPLVQQQQPHQQQPQQLWLLQQWQASGSSSNSSSGNNSSSSSSSSGNSSSSNGNSP
jgi:hypothetical protein